MLTVTKFRKETGISITTKHNDKMDGLSSLSTSPICNKGCAERSKVENSICSKCYSLTMNKRFANLRKMLAVNTEVLTSHILTSEEMPRLFSETGYFRFEAFGDLINEIQVFNYFNIAKANSHMKCAIWTKCPQIIASAMKTYGISKPENLVIIGSSYMINHENTFEKYDFIDYTFTVYSKDFAKDNNIAITCGGNSCADCGKCYERTHTTRNITELLK